MQLIKLAAAVVAMSAFSAHASFESGAKGLENAGLNANEHGQYSWNVRDVKRNDNSSQDGSEHGSKHDNKGSQSGSDDRDHAEDCDDAACQMQPGLPTGAGTPIGPRPSDVAAVPLPAAVWLLGTGLIGLVGVARRKA